MNSEKTALTSLKFLSMTNAIYEGIVVYEINNEKAADFLGVRCKQNICVGVVYYPSRAYFFLKEKNNPIVKGSLIFTNHPEDLLDFFKNKESALENKNNCYSTRNSFLTISYEGEARLLDNEKLEVRLILTRICEQRWENCLPLNRFTNLLLELLVNVTKQKYYCLINDYENYEKLKKINEYIIEVMNRHAKESQALRTIMIEAEEIKNKWSTCNEQ